MSDYEVIYEIAKQNHNIFKTRMIVEAGVRKERIKELLEQNKIKKIGHGCYILNEAFLDRYYEFQMRYPKAIYSYRTAAFILGLIDNPGEELECTFPRGYNASFINSRMNTKFHFVSSDIYEMGLTEELSPFGSNVKLYNKERIVCDYIKHKSRCEIQIWGTVLNNYFRQRDKDIKRLIKYAKVYGILDDLEMYVELLQ